MSWVCSTRTRFRQSKQTELAELLQRLPLLTGKLYILSLEGELLNNLHGNDHGSQRLIAACRVPPPQEY
jgi:hypothetical protein